MQTEFSKCRKRTEELIKEISVEDMNIQTEIFVSPTKWHLAHTTWFFEKFILEKKIKNYKFHDQLYNFLFNSYYNSVGNQFPRDKRGNLSRPSVEEILKYREIITARIFDLLDKKNLKDDEKFMIELGINHEQQHQELILTDILNVYFNNPLKPCYNNKKKKKLEENEEKIDSEDWLEIDSSHAIIGNETNGFCFDNELPKHIKNIAPFRIKKSLVTNYDWKSFIDDGGYERPEFWLSDGFDFITKNQIKKPLYWMDNDFQFTLNGVQKINDLDPVCHISFFEADAFATWKKKRIPTECEIEFILKKQKLDGNFVEKKRFEAINTRSCTNEMDQFFGNVWEWSSSNYVGYENFKTWNDSIGEYNGKFMCNQFVLKGGSAFTPKSHIRASYRNFFYPSDRWQLSGFRLAENIND